VAQKFLAQKLKRQLSHVAKLASLQELRGQDLNLRPSGYEG
jgi:hypothetical protein